ncbi:glycosyltransferase family 87 protein [Aquirufa ecclesiirivi]|uniref:glycosyltransferase family 87 protein n=1 Tax=Aquirufa ecclesiirivi TaxID=2715124 RepID=UPI0023D7FA0E|nr:glycosyltransferase family 87 protein [Aquirufa ecclesiirivi]MDF0694491.1 glycosyltransferase family 87 protein [Aquirufa ecclesiirivi]
MENKPAFYARYEVLLGFWFIAGLFTGIKQYNLGELNSHINNFIIFKSSYGHFIQRMPLYLEYPKEYFDLYLYGPIFAILMAPFAFLPTAISVTVWNVINALVLFLAVWNLPLDQKKRVAISWIILNSTVTALLNTQFHPLCIALILWSYICIHRGQDAWAALWIVLGICIKLYGVVGLAFFFFSKKPLRLAGYLIFWMWLILLLPMFLGGWDYGMSTYMGWKEVLSHKNELNVDIRNLRTDVCVMGMFRRWTGDGTLSNLWFLIPSMVLNLYVFFQIKKWKDVSFQLRIVAFVSIYLMLASTGTESPTLIMAFPGVGIWFVLGEKTKSRRALLLLTLLISSFSPTDLFPQWLRNEWVNPLGLMILPLFLVWLAIAWDLVKLGPKETPRL